MKRNFIILGFVVVLIFLSLIFYFIFTNSISPTPSGTNIIPVPTDFSKNYSNINRLIPGKSNASDVEKINGAPFSKTTFGGKTYFYYQTPSGDYKNFVVIENGLVSYALENVFGEYRGNYSSYQRVYGEPNLKLVSDDGFNWYVFLNKGLGVETSNDEVLKLLYFIPQNKESFMKNISPDIKASEESQGSQGNGEQLVP